MNVHEMMAALAEPFAPEQIHWRVGATTGDKSKGIALAYIDARDVMDRLDAVAGPENWADRYPFAGCCEIGIYCGDERGWVWKANGAGATDVEAEKGQYSDAFKRAAVMWGIGRYLYALPNTWVPLTQKGRSHVIAPGAEPKLPAWALPGTKKAPPKETPQQPAQDRETSRPGNDTAMSQGDALPPLDHNYNEPDTHEERASAADVAKIRALIKETGADEERYLRFLKAPSLEALPLSRVAEAVAALETKRRSQQQQSRSAAGAARPANHIMNHLKGAK